MATASRVVGGDRIAGGDIASGGGRPKILRGQGFISLCGREVAAVICITEVLFARLVLFF